VVGQIMREMHNLSTLLVPIVPALPKSVQGVALRVLRRADLMAFDRRIHNWSQILPYRVFFARYPNSRLQKDILCATAVRK
jgi:hypothetical protein